MSHSKSTPADAAMQAQQSSFDFLDEAPVGVNETPETSAISTLAPLLPSINITPYYAVMAELNGITEHPYLPKARLLRAALNTLFVAFEQGRTYCLLSELQQRLASEIHGDMLMQERDSVEALSAALLSCAGVTSAPTQASESAANNAANNADNNVTKSMQQQLWVLDDGCLYFQRFWCYQQQLIKHLALRTQSPVNDDAHAHIQTADAQMMNLLDLPDWSDQSQFIVTAMHERLVLLSGGPGTGKTTSLAKLLLMLQSRALLNGEALDIALAAPTGKAALRMSESVMHTLTALTPGIASHPHFTALVDAVPKQALTVHKLLAYHARTAEFRKGKAARLNADVVVIDESSMIDIAMMVQLFDALRDDAQLILLGDPQQLNAVEVGSVFADMCPVDPQCINDAHLQRLQQAVEATWPQADDDLPQPISHPVSAAMRAYSIANGDLLTQAEAAKQHGLHHVSVLLRQRWRFDDDSALGQLAQACIAGEAQPIIQSTAYHGALKAPQALDWKSHWQGYFDTLQQAHQYAENKAWAKALLDSAQAFRILNAVHDGNTGIVAFNHSIDEHCREQWRSDGQTAWLGSRVYHGQMVLITENDANLGLFNGDTGVVLHDPSSQQFKVWFYSFDPAQEGVNIRSIEAALLPKFSSAWCISVHKSQGSEYQNVAVVLPDYPSTVLNRSLLYTALTRARETASIYAEQSIIEHTLNTPAPKATQLGSFLTQLSKSNQTLSAERVIGCD